MYLFIYLFYMFRTTQCPSSGESSCINTSSGMCHSLKVTAWYADKEGPAYQAVTYTEWHIPNDLLIQLDSPDDEYWVVRNM
jgi:hypothetical protein